MRIIKKISKWIHKYTGLLLILFLVWMSISGILLNHPEAISPVSVPALFVPRQYTIDNWQRGALNEAVFPTSSPGMVIAGGKEGIWQSNDKGETFRSFMNGGFPSGAYNRKTNSLLLLESDTQSLLLACTYGGVYYRNIRSGGWYKIAFPGEGERPVKLAHIPGGILLFTESNIYESTSQLPPFNFRLATPARSGSNEATLIKLFFDLHSGANLGLPGRILYDIAGIVLIVLSVTAFYTWYYPNKLKLRRRMKRRTPRKNPALFKFLLKYHLHLGIWSAFILIIISFTGLFMRPPLLVALAGRTISADAYPGFLPDNPWYEKIRNAAYNPQTGELLVDCRDGMYAGKLNAGESFHGAALPIDVFVMGATVMQFDSSGTLLLGSFNGLYLIDMETQHAIDASTGSVPEHVSPLRPGEYMITGYFQTPDGAHFITTHDGGLQQVGGSTTYGPFVMAREKLIDQSMPLWNYLFELHNGRLFQDFIHDWYILLVPLGSLLSLLLIATGVIDWFIVRRRTKRIPAKPFTE